MYNLLGNKGKSVKSKLATQVTLDGILVVGKSRLLNISMLLSLITRKVTSFVFTRLPGIDPDCLPVR